MTSSKYELQNIPGFIENLCSHNKNLNEKAKLLNEKCKSLEEENSNMKLAYSKQQKKMKELKLKFSDSDETLIDKLRRKSIKIVELKKMLGHQNSRSKLKVSEINTNVSDYSVIESQMSVIEEELNLLKTENRILISKENDLCSKLKNSEKARYYYQEQTIGLKEKVNSLENHLKMLESSVLELKAVKDSPDYQNQFKRS
jgi:chromosome segregation ATPase